MEEELVEEKVTVWKPDASDIAIEIQRNVQAEATAIVDYNCLLSHVSESDLPKAQKEFIRAEIYEIIGDELNHQRRLGMLYSTVSKIKANKD